MLTIRTTLRISRIQIQDLTCRYQTGQINGQGVSGTLAQVITNNQPVNVYYLKPFQGFDAGGNQIIGGTPQFAGDPNPHSLVGFGTNRSVTETLT
jgi:hypothetical protein